MNQHTVIEFSNLVESCGSLGDGNVVSIQAAKPSRPFTASNASGEAVMRTRSQINSHASKLAKLMCTA